MKASNLIVSPGSHWHEGTRISLGSYAVMAALAPAAIAGVLAYGPAAMGTIGLSMAAAMIAEALAQIARRKPVTLADGSAALSGLILALILPAGVPVHVVVVASALGIILGKQVFGGLGANPLNPALVGWAIIRITQSWAGFLDFDLALTGTWVQSAYPLAILKAEGAAGVADLDRLQLFLGRQSGGIGAAAGVWLVAGGLFLVLRGVLRWELPVFFLLGAALASGAFHLADQTVYADPLFHLITGNVLIAAFFFTADGASTPVNRWGMVAFGLSAGALAMVLRVLSGYPDGVVFAFLIVGLFTPLFDKIKAKQRLPRPKPIPAPDGAKGASVLEGGVQ